MKKLDFNGNWLFERLATPDAPAVPVTLPHDAMLHEARQPDCVNGHTTLSPICALVKNLENWRLRICLSCHRFAFVNKLRKCMIAKANLCIVIPAERRYNII